jgi:uncharacterized protein (DUF2336 family)
MSTKSTSALASALDLVKRADWQLAILIERNLPLICNSRAIDPTDLSTIIRSGDPPIRQEALPSVSTLL